MVPELPSLREERRLTRAQYSQRAHQLCTLVNARRMQSGKEPLRAQHIMRVVRLAVGPAPALAYPDKRAPVSIYDRILRNQQAQRATPDAGNPLSYKFTPSADGEPNMEPKENPLITQEIKLWGRLMSILGTLGLTPADRAKMTTPKSDEAEDKWAGILS